MRILLACLLIWDWLLRWPTIRAFYTNLGVRPIDGLPQNLDIVVHWSLLNGIASPASVRVTFAFGLACYVLLLIGYRTRTATILSFAFFASVLNRNPLLRLGMDRSLAAALFWSMFLPLGDRFSIDARGRAGVSGSDADHCRPASLALLLQIAIIYFMGAHMKDMPAWKDGTALYYVWSESTFSNPLGRWLAATSPLWLLRFGARATVAIEYSIVCLLLSPVAQPLSRRCAFGAMLLLQGGIACTMDVGLFPFVMIAMSAALLTGSDWELIQRARESETWRSGLAALRTSWPGFGSRGRVPRSASEHASVPRPPETALGRALALGGDALSAAMLLAVFVDVCLLTVSPHGSPDWLRRAREPEPSVMRSLLRTLQLRQDWNLFAPRPLNTGGWWVVDGITRSGERIDPLTGKWPSFDPPRSALPGSWDRYLFTVKDHHFPPSELRRLARYLVGENLRDASDDARLARFDIYYVWQYPSPPELGRGSTTKRQWCWHQESMSDARDSGWVPQAPEAGALDEAID